MGEVETHAGDAAQYDCAEELSPTWLGSGSTASAEGRVHVNLPNTLQFLCFYTNSVRPFLLSRTGLLG